MGKEYVDILTGEIVSKGELTTSLKRHRTTRYVGIDTKWPCECKTSDTLLEALSSLDAFLGKPVQINYAAIMKALHDGHITQKESAILVHLCEALVGWNYYIGRLCDLDLIVPDKKNLAKMVKTLESKNLIKLTHKSFLHKDSVVVMIHPFYAWKGDTMQRDRKLQEWAAPKGVMNYSK